MLLFDINDVDLAPAKHQISRHIAIILQIDPCSSHLFAHLQLLVCWYLVFVKDSYWYRQIHLPYVYVVFFSQKP